MSGERLEAYNGFDATVLPHPLNDPELFTGGRADGYVLAAGRVNATKRQALLIRALRHAPGVRLVVAGPPDSPSDVNDLRRFADAEGVGDRLTLDLRLLPRLELAALVNAASAVAYIPLDEEFLVGYVTMEAFHAGKPLITTTDAGGVLQLARDGETGWVTAPSPGSTRRRAARCCCRCGQGRSLRCGREAGALRHGIELAACCRATPVMSYRIAWAGPWHERSAIAAFGSDVLNVLAARATASRCSGRRPGPAPNCRRCRPRSQCTPLASSPTISWPVTMISVFVNFGDNFPYPRRGAVAPRADRRHCHLHDANMTNFGNGWRAQVPAAPAPVDSMVEFVAARSIAAVVHAQHYRAEVEAACLGPVIAMPLAMTFAHLCNGLPAPPGGRKFVVATIGYVNSNKRADQVIRAMGASPRLRERARYILIGPIEEWQRESLTALAHRVGAPMPEFTGWVPDRTLRELLTGVDAICCLRDPLTEGGSASLILALRSGRPTVVSEQGTYAEVPDDVVLKCPPGREAAHVVHHLETLMKSHEGALALGERARRFAEATYAPEPYARGLLALAEQAARTAPAILAQRRIGGTLYSLGLPCDPISMQTATRGLSGLLGGRDGELHDGVGDGQDIENRAGTG